MTQTTTHPRNSFTNPVLAEIRMDAGFFSVLGWYFTVARALYALDSASIPAEWDYTAAPDEVADDGDPFDFDDLSHTEALLLDLDYDVDDLLFMGNVIVRYLTALKAAGMDEVSEF